MKRLKELLFAELIPEANNPGPNDPGPNDPGSNDPGPNDSGPNNPGPSDPKSTDENMLELEHNSQVYLVVRRKKTTLHLDALENTTVLQLKKMIEAIFKISPEDQQLTVVSISEQNVEQHVILSEDTAPLSEYEINWLSAQASSPVTLGLAMRTEDGSFEELDITPYSEPQWPDLTLKLVAKTFPEDLAIFRDTCMKKLFDKDMSKKFKDKS
ncbi:uncharacterized protein LOC105432868 [Pogonomyrmex barbatus]|uniref:Uncharacterized protein LOC105432868 n=1 Tax=Pogonomyrmex barbatus TaxID=144034 RepID=A0A6I9WQT2_9HYME|nr:uncharacterized protein LOC105432868 [Pogonomyrmex barbatus]XP_011646146.1 uncharacterized protein LOC105432868 [Pogonomyrmex barbatus]